LKKFIVFVGDRCNI